MSQTHPYGNEQLKANDIAATDVDGLGRGGDTKDFSNEQLWIHES